MVKRLSRTRRAGRKSRRVGRKTRRAGRKTRRHSRRVSRRHHRGGNSCGANVELAGGRKRRGSKRHSKRRGSKRGGISILGGQVDKWLARGGGDFCAVEGCNGR